MTKKLFIPFVLFAVLSAACSEEGGDTKDPEPTMEYSITVSAAENGEITVTVDGEAVTKAVEDAEISIEASPDEGYKFVEWTVTGATLTDATANPATFAMPAADIIVEAEFEVFDDSPVVQSGEVGPLTWTLTEKGTLTISGEGDIPDYEANILDTSAPWYQYAEDIKAVIMEDGVTGIGDRAFYNCEALVDITIPNSVTSVGNSAFDMCESLTSVNIPDGVTSIGDNAFLFCDLLTSVTIGEGVTAIGENAFGVCPALTGIEVVPGNPSFTSENGVLFNKNKSEIICCPGSKSGEYTIPSSVTTIGVLAFYFCDALTGISIPDGVTTIEDGAFFSCASLTSITIPDNVTSIGREVFQNCKGLTSIIIGAGVKTIGNNAFAYCSLLTSVTIMATEPPSLTTPNFAVSDDTLYVPKGFESAYRSYAGWRNSFTTIVEQD
jgi:hypothetical protein